MWAGGARACVRGVGVCVCVCVCEGVCEGVWVYVRVCEGRGGLKTQVEEKDKKILRHFN